MESVVYINYPERTLPATYTRGYYTQFTDRYPRYMRYDESKYGLVLSIDKDGRAGKLNNTFTPHRKRPNVPSDDGEIIDLLIAAGADVNAEDKVSGNSYMWCASVSCKSCYGCSNKMMYVIYLKSV